MILDDLEALPLGHPPSPYDHPVFIRRGEREGQGVLPEGLTLLAVGWLGWPGKHVTGSTPDRCIARLFDSYERRLIFSDGTMGWHACTLCPGSKSEDRPVVSWKGREQSLYGHGHHLVQDGSNVYMCPALILHYIIDHRYKPPGEFTKAVEHGRFLQANDLVFVEGDW